MRKNIVGLGTTCDVITGNHYLLQQKTYIFFYCKLESFVLYFDMSESEASKSASGKESEDDSYFEYNFNTVEPYENDPEAQVMILTKTKTKIHVPNSRNVTREL